MQSLKMPLSGGMMNLIKTINNQDKDQQTNPVIISVGAVHKNGLRYPVNGGDQRSHYC